MDNFIIFISLLMFAFSGYLVWPSRYNVVAHLAAAGSFISIFVPTLILNIPEKYPQSVVNLFVNVLLLGVISYFPSFVLGFALGKNKRTAFSFDVMDSEVYERKMINLTKALLIAGILGMIISYIVMGFVPMFAADPISAKLFRGSYQEPYRRVAVLFRASFYILAVIMPIACIIWYKYRIAFFFYAILAVMFLLVISLVRSGAFGGIVLAFAIIMSFKSRFHFFILMVCIVGVFIGSSFFYYILGIKTLSPDQNIWEVIAAGSSDIEDQLQFLVRFEENPVFTYGRTIYGGLIPGHYKWNPSVYTLNVIAPGVDINDVGSGGIRLALPLWGYVSFRWIGVVVYSFVTGILAGFFLRLLKNWFKLFPSIVIRTIGVIIYGTVFGTIIGFTQLNMYAIPPIIVVLFYMYRIKWR